MQNLIFHSFILLLVCACGFLAIRLCSLGLITQSADAAMFRAVSTIVLPANFFH